MTAAVFDTNIDRNPVAIIKPNNILAVLAPIYLIIVKATRVCKFHLSIAIARMKPPKNKKIISLPYSDDTASGDNTWPIGNKISGKKLVAAIGIASVIHQIAIHTVIANTKTPFSGKAGGWKKINIKAKHSGPKISPNNCPKL